MTEINVLSAMRQRFHNPSIRLPRDIEVEIINSVCRIVLLSENVVSKNMQEDCNAFEGWAAALYLALGSAFRITLDVDKPLASNGYTGKGHYCRFLYRSMKFSEQYDWFDLSAGLQKEVDRFKAYLSAGIFMNNIPCGAAHESKNKECYAEARLAEPGILKKQLNGQFHVGDGTVYRQLPVGLFKSQVAEKNMVFTGSKSAVDLWNICEEEFRIYELKTQNKMVGIVTETFFYANYFCDFLLDDSMFVLNDSIVGDRGYSEIVAAKACNAI